MQPPSAQLVEGRQEARPWLMAALGCVLASAVILGGGSRIVMRITAMIAPPGSIGQATVGGNVIGRVTFGGSVGLVWIGALGGLPLATLYLVARRWLPPKRVTRGLWFGLLVKGVFGAILLGDTSDFRFAEAGRLYGLRTAASWERWSSGSIIGGGGANQIITVGPRGVVIPIHLLPPARASRTLGSLLNLILESAFRLSGQRSRRDDPGSGHGHVGCSPRAGPRARRG